MSTVTLTLTKGVFIAGTAHAAGEAVTVDRALAGELITNGQAAKPADWDSVAGEGGSVVRMTASGALVGAGGEVVVPWASGQMMRAPVKVGPYIEETTIVNFDTTAPVAPVSATKALETSITAKVGTACVKLTGTTPGTATQASAAAAGTYDRWGTWVYVYDYTKINYIVINYGQGASGYTDSLQTPNYYPRYNGWHYIQAAKDGGANAFTYTGAGATSVAVARVRILAYPQAGEVAIIAWDAILAGGRSLPDVLFTFDDGYGVAVAHDKFTAPCDYLAGLGIPATLAIFGSAIGASEGADYASTYATIGMLRRAYLQGHEFAVHGTTSYLTLGDYASVYADIVANRDWLINHGFSRGAECLVYPIGSYGDVAYINQAVTDAGMVIARETYRLSAVPANIIKSDTLMKRLWIIGHDATADTVAAIKARIDGAIAAGMHIVLMFHSFSVAGGANANDCAISDFYEIADYVAAKAKLGLCQPVTMSEFYSRRM